MEISATTVDRTKAVPTDSTTRLTTSTPAALINGPDGHVPFVETTAQTTPTVGAYLRSKHSSSKASTRGA